MATLSRYADWLSDKPQHRAAVRALQVSLGLVLLVRVITELPWAPLLWSGNGWPLSRSLLEETSAASLGRLFSTEGRVYCAMGCLALAGALLIAGAATRVATAVGAVAFVLLFNRLRGATDGGDALVRLLLVYGVLFVDGRDARPGPLRTWVHNLGVVLVATQICLLYVGAAASKMTGGPWLNGTATYLISQNDFYVSEAWRKLFEVPFATALSTYAVIVLELWYPVAMFSTLRRYWLVLMIVFHVWTILGMGLLTFGMAMVGANIFMLKMTAPEANLASDSIARAPIPEDAASTRS